MGADRTGGFASGSITASSCVAVIPQSAAERAADRANPATLREAAIVCATERSDSLTFTQGRLHFARINGPGPREHERCEARSSI